MIDGLALHDGASENENQQFLTFSVGAEEYGVNLMQVREICAWKEVTRIPNTSPYMLGVMNLRGAIIPVHDLRARFSGELTVINPKKVVVILSVDGRNIGVLVDAVSDIAEICNRDVLAPPNTDPNAEKYISGIISFITRMIVVLDMAALFNPDEVGIPLAGGKLMSDQEMKEYVADQLRENESTTQESESE